jgi:CHAD domain-containing protein
MPRPKAGSPAASRPPVLRAVPAGVPGVRAAGERDGATAHRRGPPHAPPAPAATSLARATPVALADRVQRDLEARLGAFTAAAGRARRNADDEAIHDLRVAARRLSVALGLWRGVLRPRPRRRAARRLQRMRRRLGPLRELEVHATRLPDWARTLSGEAGAAAEALEAALERRLLRARRRAARPLAPPRVRRIHALLRQAWRDLPQRVERRPEAPAGARQRTEAQRHAALDALARAAARRDAAALHTARIEVKKWRYALECLGPVLDEPPRLDLLRSVQEALGAVQDRVVFLAWVERHARRWQRRGSLALAEAVRPLIERLEAEHGGELERATVRVERLLAAEAPAGPATSEPELAR